MTFEKAILLLIKHKVPEHIIHHSYKVTKISFFICEELEKKNLKVNKDLCIFASLLHDITKYQSIINKGEDHSLTGGKLLRSLGYPDIAEIIESHVELKNLNYLKIEKEIVFYSDKRVKHHEIVSLKERYEDLKRRYGFSEKVKKGFEVALNIENNLKNFGIKTELLHLLN